MKTLPKYLAVSVEETSCPLGTVYTIFVTDSEGRRPVATFSPATAAPRDRYLAADAAERKVLALRAEKRYARS